MSASRAEEVAPLVETLVSLAGLAPARVWLGHGGNVTMEFGAEQPNGRREWHLWVQHAVWRVDSPEKILAGCEDSDDVIEEALRSLENQPISSVDVDPVGLGFDLDFGVAVFRCFPVELTDDCDHWLLFTPHRKEALVAGPGSGWSWTE